MNIWDSVQRGLEKASQEAARIAKTQRLRSTVDQLSRQIYTQHDAIIGRVMDLYNSNQLTQSELIPLCQDLMSMHSRLKQAEFELQQMQSQAPPPQQQGALPPGPGAPGQAQIPPALGQTPAPPGSYPPSVQDMPTVIAPPPPDYQFYLDPTVAIPTAPPPPGVEPPTSGSAETLAVEAGAPRHCFLCHAAILPGNAFCQNCGTPVGDISSSYLATSRASLTPPPPGGDYATIAAPEPAATSAPPPSGEQTPANAPVVDDDATVRAPKPEDGGQ